MVTLCDISMGCIKNNRHNKIQTNEKEKTMIKPILFAVSAIFATAMSSNTTAFEEIYLECYKNGELLWADSFSDYRDADNASRICRRIGGTPIMY